jgi:hypothetical protein
VGGHQPVRVVQLLCTNDHPRPRFSEPLPKQKYAMCRGGRTGATIEWSEEHRTGLPDIDKDRERLFALLNELNRKAETGTSGNDPPRVMEDLMEHVA